jgi:hypothetical protein
MLKHRRKASQLLQEVWRTLPNLPPLPATTFPLGEVNAALDFMAKGVHMGKVLLANTTDDLPLLHPASIDNRASDSQPSVLSLSSATANDVEEFFTTTTQSPHFEQQQQQHSTNQDKTWIEEAHCLNKEDPVLRSLLPFLSRKNTEATDGESLDGDESAGDSYESTDEEEEEICSRGCSEGSDSVSDDENEEKEEVNEEGNTASAASSKKGLRFVVIKDLSDFNQVASTTFPGFEQVDCVVTSSRAVAAMAEASGNVAVVLRLRVGAWSALPALDIIRLLKLCALRRREYVINHHQVAAAAAAESPGHNESTAAAEEEDFNEDKKQQTAAFPLPCITLLATVRTSDNDDNFLTPNNKSLFGLGDTTGIADTAENDGRSGGGDDGIFNRDDNSGEGESVLVREFQTWLVAAVCDLAGVPLPAQFQPNSGGIETSGEDDDDQDDIFDFGASLESLGVDSLAQIGLARRISFKLKVPPSSFGVSELARHDTVNALTAVARAKFNNSQQNNVVQPRSSGHSSGNNGGVGDGNQRKKIEASQGRIHAPPPAAAKQQHSAAKIESFPPVPPPLPNNNTFTSLRAPPLRVLCFHGFRSNRDLLEASLTPLLNAALGHSGSGGSAAAPSSLLHRLVFEFIDAPHPASGPSEPGIPPEVPTFEWWSGDSKSLDSSTQHQHNSYDNNNSGDFNSNNNRTFSYEEGWKSFGSPGLFESSVEAALMARDNRENNDGSRLHSRSSSSSSKNGSVAAEGRGQVVGVLGFSQGGAMACALAQLAASKSAPLSATVKAAAAGAEAALEGLRFVACFSAVPPRNITQSPPEQPTARGALLLPLPSFHCFDPAESHAELCAEVKEMFKADVRTTVHHQGGHGIPRKQGASEHLGIEFRSFLESVLRGASEAQQAH